MSDIEKAMQDYQLENKKRADSARESLVRCLKDAGVKQVDVQFDGSGDSGQIEAIVYTPGKGDLFGGTEVDGTETELTSWASGEPRRAIRNRTVDELVEEACYGILENSHPGWEINEGAFGDFVIDVENDRISLNFNQRIEAVESYEEEY